MCVGCGLLTGKGRQKREILLVIARSSMYVDELSLVSTEDVCTD